LLQDSAHHAAIENCLLQPLRQAQAQGRAQRQAAAQRTKVEFFTVAREADTSGNEGDER